MANDPNCDTNEPPLALGGSLYAKGVHPQKTNNPQKSKYQLFAQFNWVETE